MNKLSSIIEDDTIQWRIYDGEMPICSRFSIDVWHKMVSDIHSDEDWRQFLIDYPDLIRCYVLYNKQNGMPIAFTYIMVEDDYAKIVSFHGGGWDNSLFMSLMFYRGMFVLVESLLKLGLKVRTACDLDNIRTYRFLKGAGFVCYRTTAERYLFWINISRLRNSKAYKYFNKK